MHGTLAANSPAVPAGADSGDFDLMQVILEVGDPVVVAILGAVGILLLLWGGRLLRPGLFLAAVVLGMGLGVRLAVMDGEHGLLGVPPLAWVVGLPVLMAILSLLLYRLFLACLLGLSSASAGFLMLLVAYALFGDGTAMDATSEQEGGSRSSQVEPAMEDASDGESGDRAVIDRIQEIASSAVEEHARSQFREQLDEVGRDLAASIDSSVLATGGWLWDRAKGLNPTIRAIAVGVAVVCGLLGFLLGLISPQRVARVATAVVGGWLLAAVAVAAWNRVDSTGNGPPAMGILIAWAVLSGIGITVQCTRKPVRADEAS
ncbi:MAG: hypothetical protein MK085_12130 [Phycisphaerales bacterium]|nr:hypothetical protein [Phycisphaerales bacterium]